MAASPNVALLIGALLLVVGGVALTPQGKDLLKSAGLGSSSLSLSGGRVNHCQVKLSVVTDATKKCFSDVKGKTKIVGAAGGCGTLGTGLGLAGASIGSLVPGAGTAIGGGVGFAAGCLAGAFGGWYGGDLVGDVYASYAACPTSPHIESFSCTTNGERPLICPSSTGQFAVTTYSGQVIMGSQGSSGVGIPIIGQKLGGNVQEAYDLDKLFGMDVIKEGIVCTDDTTLYAKLVDDKNELVDQASTQVIGR